MQDETGGVLTSCRRAAGGLILSLIGWTGPRCLHTQFPAPCSAAASSLVLLIATKPSSAFCLCVAAISAPFYQLCCVFVCVMSIIWVDEVFHLLAAPSSPATDFVVVASAAAVAVSLLQERKHHRQNSLSLFFFCLFCSLQSSFDWTLTRQTNRQSTFPRSGAELRRFNNLFNLCECKAASSRLPAGMNRLIWHNPGAVSPLISHYHPARPLNYSSNAPRCRDKKNKLWKQLID